MLKSISLVAIAKIVFGLLTGAFGLLAALTESKNHETGRLTIWGWVSIVGILLSAFIGATIQYFETLDAKATADIEAAKQNRLIQTTRDTMANTEGTMAKVERMLTPVGESPELQLEFFARCKRGYWSRFCTALKMHLPGDAGVGFGERNRVTLPGSTIFFVRILPKDGRNIFDRSAVYKMEVNSGERQGAVTVERLYEDQLMVLITGRLALQAASRALALSDLPDQLFIVESEAGFFRSLQFVQADLITASGRDIMMNADDAVLPPSYSLPAVKTAPIFRYAYKFTSTDGMEEHDAFQPIPRTSSGTGSSP